MRLTEDQSVRLTDSGRLAGSALSMNRGVEKLQTFAGLTLEQALVLGTVRPAQAMRFEDRQRFLEPGDAAELIYFNHDPETKKMDVTKTVMSDG